MIYISVAKAAKKWGVSERSVRNYCAEGRVAGARLVGKTWEIPEVAEKPKRAQRSDKKRCSIFSERRSQRAFPVAFITECR